MPGVQRIRFNVLSQPLNGALEPYLVWENKGHMPILSYSLKFETWDFFIDRSNLASLLPHELELLPLCSGNWLLRSFDFQQHDSFYPGLLL